MRAIVGLWRWRHNPLCRRTDLAEAWVALAALLLICCAVPATGFAVGGVVRDALHQSVQRQHQERERITATVVSVSRQPLDPDPETASAREGYRRVTATWPAPDGTVRRGAVPAQLRAPGPGDRFPLWTDRRSGHAVGEPMDGPTASTHAALAGFGAAAACVGLVEGLRRLLVWRLLQVRYARLDQAWDRAGPDWGRAGTGS